MSESRAGLVGNRWMLVGGVVYLLEWVAIIWVGVIGVGETVVRGADVASLRESYLGHPDALASMAGMAGWFAVVLLDRVGVGLNLMIGGGLGVAILCASYCMWTSGWFSTPLNIVGLVSGLGIVGAQLAVAPSLETLFNLLYISPLLFWVWMIWAGVVLWRRTPRRVGTAAEGASVA